jgi:hypothetical protein
MDSAGSLFSFFTDVSDDIICVNHLQFLACFFSLILNTYAVVLKHVERDKFQDLGMDKRYYNFDIKERLG